MTTTTRTTKSKNHRKQVKKEPDDLEIAKQRIEMQETIKRDNKLRLEAEATRKAFVLKLKKKEEEEETEE